MNEHDLGTRLVRKDGRICWRARDYELGRDLSGQIVRLERRNGNLVAISESGELRTCIEKRPIPRPLLRCKRCRKAKFIYARGICEQCYGGEKRKIYKGQKSKFLDGRTKKTKCRRCGRTMILDGMGHCRNCAMTVADARAKARKRNGRIRDLEERVQELEIEVRRLKEMVSCGAR